jgi:MYXO-CTERM domain-containing protein
LPAAQTQGPASGDGGTTAPGDGSPGPGSPGAPSGSSDAATDDNGGSGCSVTPASRSHSESAGLGFAVACVAFVARKRRRAT